MKRKMLSVILALTLLVSTFTFGALAAYAPPTTFGAPQNVGAVLTIDDDYVEGSDRWDFSIGYATCDQIRGLLAAESNGSFEEAGYDSLNVYVEGDYKLDNGKWRSELPGYDDWVSPQDTYFDAENGTWTGSYNMSDYVFDEILTDGILPGGKSYFDNHTMSFRLRFNVSYHGEEGYEYLSPWSSVVSYTNTQKAEDPAVLINHAPKLISVELKKNADGMPYLEFMSEKAHSDIQLLNSISDQRIYTNVWVKVNNGQWVDTGTYLFMLEKFTVEAKEIFGDVKDYEAAVYEAKFRYSFDYDYYPAAGKSGTIHSPFSNGISHGMPAYQGATQWAIPELNQAAELGLITDRIKGKMNAYITREEFAEVAVRYYEVVTGKKAEPHPTETFKDTTNPEILKALNLGITTGVGNGRYDPSAILIREQMAAMITRTLKASDPTANLDVTGQADFKDQKNFKGYGLNSAKFMAKYKITLGDGKGNFLPNDQCTREQAIAFLVRGLNYKDQY